MCEKCGCCAWFGDVGKVHTSRDKTVVLRGPCMNKEYKGNTVTDDGRVISKLIYPSQDACGLFVHKTKK